MLNHRLPSVKKIVSVALVTLALNGCSVASAYTGFFMGGEDLAHAAEKKHKLLGLPAFLAGTIAGPFVGFYWGLTGDVHIMLNLHTLAGPRGPHLDIPSDNFTLAQYPFTGPARIEEESALQASVR